MLDQQPRAHVHPRTAFDACEHVVIILNTPDAPDDAEWGAMMQFIEQHLAQHEHACILVYTLGGAPNRIQRSSFERRILKHYEASRHEQIKLAVVTDAVMARMALKALSWVNSQVRGFKPDDMTGALTFLKVDPKLRALMNQHVANLCQHYGMAPPTLS